MSGRDLVERHLADAPVGSGGDPGQGANALPAVLTGELVGMADNGRTPLVLYPNQPCTAALRARAVVDLHGGHIGQPVVLMFENGDPALPIVMGVLLPKDGWPLAQQPARDPVTQQFIKGSLASATTLARSEQFWTAVEPASRMW